MADPRFVQVFMLGDKVRRDGQVVSQVLLLGVWINWLVTVEFPVERLVRETWLSELLKPLKLALTDCHE